MNNKNQTFETIGKRRQKTPKQENPVSESKTSVQDEFLRFADISQNTNLILEEDTEYIGTIVGYKYAKEGTYLIPEIDVDGENGCFSNTQKYPLDIRNPFARAIRFGLKDGKKIKPEDLVGLRVEFSISNYETTDRVFQNFNTFEFLA